MRAVIFDLGNTLIDYLGSAGQWLEMERRGFTAVHRRLAGRPDEPSWEAFREAMEQSISACWEEATSGRHSPTVQTVVERALASLDLPADEAFLVECAGDYCRPIAAEAVVFPDVRPGLEAIHRAGYRLGLISNTFWPGEHHVADLERFGLRDYFDELVFSSEAGVWKPDPRIFHLATDALGVEPAEAVFVGDRLVDDVGGAQRAGLRGILREHGQAENDYARGAELGIVPHARIRALTELPPIIDAWRRR